MKLRPKFNFISDDIFNDPEFIEGILWAINRDYLIGGAYKIEGSEIIFDDFILSFYADGSLVTLNGDREYMPCPFQREIINYYLKKGYYEVVPDSKNFVK